jgi:acyl-CoA thioesterase
MGEHEKGRAAHASGDVSEAILEASRREPYAGKMGMRCLEVSPGACRVQMTVGDDMVNLFGTAHGGAVFSVIDEAFQVAVNAAGVVAYALNLSVTYISACRPGDVLVAEAREMSVTRRTSTCEIRVFRGGGELVAVAQALAYRKGGELPFLKAQ